MPELFLVVPSSNVVMKVNKPLFTYTLSFRFGLLNWLSMENLEPSKLNQGLSITKTPIIIDTFHNENLPEAHLASNFDIIEPFIFKPLAEINGVIFFIELSDVNLREIIFSVKRYCLSCVLIAI